jgi:TRAP-type C4-dicarboxylate transport system substrate-binding protein
MKTRLMTIVAQLFLKSRGGEIMKVRGILLGALVLGAALGPATSMAQEVPKMNLRWAHFAPQTWGSAQAEQLFAKEIEQRTGGNVKVRFFWNGALGGPMELMQLASSGAVNVASLVPTYYPAQWPLMGLVNSLPLTWDNVNLAMDIQAYLIENNKAIQEELAKNGLQPLLIHGLPPYRLQCTSPVRTLADLKGKRIRTFGEWPPYIMKKLGAIPVNVPLGEVYEGLQRGTLDCGYNPQENAGFLKLHEVAKYWSDINLGAIAAFTAFTGSKEYATWPAGLKKAAKDAAPIAIAWEKNNFAPAEEKHLAAAKTAGVEFVRFTEQAQLNAMFPDMLGTWEEAMCKTNDCDKVKSVVADVRKVMARNKK